MIVGLRLSRRALLGLVATLLLGFSSTGATIMRFMSVEELSRASTDVIRGTVLGQTSRWAEENKGILTYVDILVHERVKGSRPLPEVIQLVHPGGELDGTRMLLVGGPQYRDGEEAIFFLAPYSGHPTELDHVVQIGGKMGKMPVVDDEDGKGRFVLRELTGLEFAEFVPDEGSPGMEIRPGRKDPRIPLAEFVTRVKRGIRVNDSGQVQADAGDGDRK
jgi:hypothetical protein